MEVGPHIMLPNLRVSRPLRMSSLWPVYQSHCSRQLWKEKVVAIGLIQKGFEPLMRLAAETFGLKHFSRVFQVGKKTVVGIGTYSWTTINPYKSVMFYRLDFIPSGAAFSAWNIIALRNTNTSVKVVWHARSWIRRRHRRCRWLSCLLTKLIFFAECISIGRWKNTFDYI